MNLRNLKIEYIPVVLLIVGLILIGVSFLKQLNFPDKNYQLEKGSRIEIIPGETLRQKFIASRNGLSNLKILFGGKSLAEDYTINLILADKNCQKEIRKKELFSGQEFNSKNLYDFKFSPVDNSKNEVYCLKTVYKTTVKNPKKKTVRLFKNKAQQEQQKHLNYEIINRAGNTFKKKEIEGASGENGAIVFRPSYKNNNLYQDLQQLDQRISQYKPWFLKEQWVGASGAVIALIVMTVLII